MQCAHGPETIHHWENKIVWKRGVDVHSIVFALNEELEDGGNKSAVRILACRERYCSL